MIPAPTPPTIAPVLVPELEESEGDEVPGTVEEIERLAAASGVIPAATMLLLVELIVELMVEPRVVLVVEVMGELIIELTGKPTTELIAGKLTVEIYPSHRQHRCRGIFSK